MRLACLVLTTASTLGMLAGFTASTSDLADKAAALAVADVKQEIAHLENVTAAIVSKVEAEKEKLADEKKCALLALKGPEPCTFIPGGPLDAQPPQPACCTQCGYATVADRLVIEDADPPFCPAGGKPYPGVAAANGTQVITYVSPAPPAHTCVNITLQGGSCAGLFGFGGELFMSAWAGDFPYSSLTSWPAGPHAGRALYQADIGKQCYPAVASFIMPPGFCTFSIVLSSTQPSNCTYGDIQIQYQAPPAPTPTSGGT